MLEQIHAIRDHSGKNRKSYIHRRKGNDCLQVIAVTNFKGGSSRTTTAAHLAQYFALRGYKVLAVDLDPQASLSALFGIQPEFDLESNEPLYGAIRHDDAQRTLQDIISKTYFTGRDIIPGNLKLQGFEHETPRALTSSSAQVMR